MQGATVKRLCTLFVVAVAVSAALSAPASASTGPETVVSWNRTLLGILRTPGAQPATVHPTRSLAIVQLAVYDAVRASHWGSRRAAADAAAHDTLVALYPAQQPTLDQQYADMLGALPDSPRKQAGVEVGRRVAARILELRTGDGSAATPPPYVPSPGPGEYQLTPPNFPQPVFTHWANVTPFVLRSGDEFRPPPPPRLSSRRYAAALNEVQAFGVATGSARTPDQTQIGKFWTAPIQNYWNEIAQTVTTERDRSIVHAARTFAQLDVAFADATIAFYDAKYAYHFWRPITAIRNADSDGNRRTFADPGWTPLATTPADPSYPGAHSVISAAAARILASQYGNCFRFSVTSEVLPGVLRSFGSFSQAAEEAGVSRIYAGVHTRIDHVAGKRLGDEVAESVLRAF
jgi:PAP2 superfamily